MAVIKYFAYGSNMLPRRLQERVPSARVLERAQLPGYFLSFNKLSQRDGSAKANIIFSGNPRDVVHGVLYEMEETERPQLDRHEGLGKGYDLLQVCVRGRSEEHRAFTYMAPPEATREHLKPYTSYKELVVAGAKRNELPPDYIRQLEAVASVEDPGRP